MRRAVNKTARSTLYSTRPMADTPAQRSPESVPKHEAAAEPAAEPDPAFERWRRKAAWVVGYGLSADDETKRAEMKRSERVENEWSKCQKWKNDLMRNSQSVRFSFLTRFFSISFSELPFGGFYYRSRCGVYDQATGVRFWRYHPRSHPMHAVPPEVRGRLQSATRDPSLSGWLYQ